MGPRVINPLPQMVMKDAIMEVALGHIRDLVTSGKIPAGEGINKFLEDHKTYPPLAVVQINGFTGELKVLRNDKGQIFEFDNPNTDPKQN